MSGREPDYSELVFHWRYVVMLCELLEITKGGDLYQFLMNKQVCTCRLLRHVQFMNRSIEVKCSAHVVCFIMPYDVKTNIIGYQICQIDLNLNFVFNRAKDNFNLCFLFLCVGFCNV